MVGARGRTLLVGLSALALWLALAPTALADWVSAAAMNEGRTRATATLLNDGRVLVVGGLGTNTVRKTAEIYNPATDTWSAAASMSVGRFRHSATLLSNGKVLVMGGGTDAAEVYDPVANTWSLTGPLPTGHSHFEGHTATRLQTGKVLVAGGGFGLSSDADLYDPTTNTWSAAGAMGTARTFATAALLPNGTVLVAGGQHRDPETFSLTPLATTELYDPTTNAWSAADAMSTARTFATATLLPNGKVLVAGGRQEQSAVSPPLETAELYDPATNRWFGAPSMRNARAFHTATRLANGKVLVAGSFRQVIVNGQAQIRTSPSAELYDPVTNSWRSEPSMNVDRGQHVAALLRSGRVLVAGGVSESESNPALALAETYQPPRPLWSATAEMSTARELHTATPLADGRVLVAGGLDTATGVLTSAELFDPATDTWSPAESMAFPRYDFGAVRLQDGRVLVAGGDNFSVDPLLAGPLASAEIYDPATNTWSPAASMTTRRARLNLVRLATGKVLAVGGYTRVGSEITVLASAELYDPATNTWSDAGSMSAPRQLFTATLLDDGRVLAVGGTNKSLLSLTSADLYDPATNSWSAAASMNEGRVSHTATKLPSGKVLVAGGFRLILGPPLASAELYDPATDTWADAGRMQTARQLHTATLLPGGEVLVSGGMDYTNAHLWSSELYVPATNSWLSAPSLNTPRLVHTSTLLPDGRVLVVGGENVDAGSLASAEVTKALGVTLSLTKEDSPDPVTVGANVTYHLTVTNDGGATALGVTLTDELPASVVLVSATPSQGSCAGTATVTCALGSIADGASATVEIVVSTRTATTIVNRATVHDDQDPGRADATARASTTVNPATTFTVNSTTDPGDGVCDASECTLREAIKQANALGPGGPHTIVLRGGLTYTLTRAGAGEDAAATGDLDIVADMIIRVASGSAVVRGGSGWDDRIFDVLRSGAAVELRGLQIQNGAGDQGGAIWNFGTLTLTNSTVSGNSAGNGGGIYNVAGATLTNSTVSGNSALGDGGGIWNAGTVTGNNVTIAKNLADADADGAGNGGGVFNASGGTVRVANTLIGTNADQSRTTILAARQLPDCAGRLTSQGYNLIQTTTGCTIGGDTTGNITGRDPQLGPLQDNGGPTFTHALLVLASKLGTIPSPAIDAGSPGGATACPSRDQRGVLRLDGNADGVARCDIGAYEYVPPFLTPPLGTWALTPVEETVRPGKRLTYRLTWTVPPPRGWRTLATLQLRFLDDRGTALWVRFQEIAGSPGVFSVVNPKNGNAGPAFAPGSPNRLESEFATVYLAASSVDGPPGPRVTLTLTLGFKPHAAGRIYDVLVAATDDAGEVQGFHRAGAVAVTG